jgi:NitT/TauT family transport system substrate-binding protein
MISRRGALALTAVAPLALSAGVVRAQSRHVRLGAGLDDAFMEPYYAQELGLFKKANLDVEIVQVANAGAVTIAAAAGAIDVGLAEALALALAIQRGLPFAYFAGGPLTSREAPTLELVVAKNSPFQTAKDLEGKTIAVVSVKTMMSVVISNWFRLNGADPSTIKFFELHFPEMTPALERGTIDAAHLGEPFLTENKNVVRSVGVPNATVANLYYIFGWFARRDWLAANADTAHALAAALYDAGRWGNAHKAESAAIEAKYTKVDLDVVRTMARNPMSTSLTPAFIQPLLDVAARYKVLDRPFNASDLIAPGFS